MQENTTPTPKKNPPAEEFLHKKFFMLKVPLIVPSGNYVPAEKSPRNITGRQLAYAWKILLSLFLFEKRKTFLFDFRLSFNPYWICRYMGYIPDMVPLPLCAKSLLKKQQPKASPAKNSPIENCSRGKFYQ